ncbi:MAG: nuclear transport factor 2 family protein [Tunicatimonas sp.]
MTSLFVSLIALFGSFVDPDPSAEKKAIKEVITSFAQAGDKNDVPALEETLDDSYRIVMNRLFGSSEVSIMSKETYLEKIESKEYGGGSRKLTFESIVVNGTTASAKVKFLDEKMTFVSIIVLIKDANDHWKLVSDVPVVG